MKTLKKYFNSYCNLQFWKNSFVTLIRYIPMNVLEYTNIYVKFWVLPSMSVIFLDFKKINGELTLKFNRKPMRSIINITGKNLYIFHIVIWRIVCKTNLHSLCWNHHINSHRAKIIYNLFSIIRDKLW